MSISAKSFYDSLRTLEDIQKLIDAEERESATLEYKEAFKGWKDHEKKEIAKDVSAMANSEGGVIVYGVKTGKGEDKTKPVDITGLHKANTDERFVQIVNSNIRNEILGWNCRLISEDDKSVLVVEVPKSEHTPHQCLPETRYYFRSGTENKRMDHGLVELHFGKRLAPQVEVEVRMIRSKSHSKAWKTEQYSTQYNLDVWLINRGSRSARDVYSVFELPNSPIMKLDNRRKDIVRKTDILSERPGILTYACIHNVVLHPEMEVQTGQFQFRLRDDIKDTELTEPFLYWRVFAEGMLPEKGYISLADLLHGM
ncbi:MAG: ATP-binding protein [Proteobacteria bacterium]|nr:ATP-binding protein [Pseudomonadota bacterium]